MSINILDVLNQVTQSDTDKIKEGEKLLQDLKESDFNSLLFNLSTVLSNDSTDMKIRQLTGVIFKNLISQDPNDSFKWIAMDPNLKFQIKNNILSCLASEIKFVRNSASTLIAGIAKIEFEYDTWPDLFDILISTADNTEKSYRVSSLNTIGYIGQEVNELKITDDKKSELLYALLKNIFIDNNEEVLETALEALKNFSFIISNIIRNKEKRDFIFATLIECLKHNNPKIKKKVFECLIDLCRLYYKFIEDKIFLLDEITLSNYTNEDPEIAIDCMEIWCSISDEDLNQKNLDLKKKGFYCDFILENLLKYIKYHLLNRDTKIEKDNEDGWHCYKSCLILLRNLSLFSYEAVIDFVFDLIQKHLNDENSKKRESVILAFGSILQTIHSTKISAILEGAIQSLIPMLSNDNSKDVRNTICWAFKKMCQNNSEDLFKMNAETINNLIKSLIAFLNIENSKTNKKIISLICECLDNLIKTEYESYQNNKQEFTNSILSTYYEQLFFLLLTICFNKISAEAKENVFNLGFSTYNTLIGLTVYSPSNCIDFINSFFPHLIQSLESTFQKENYDSEIFRASQQENLCNLIANTIASNKVRIDLEKGNYVYELVKKMFLERVNVFESGISICSSLALALGKSFKQQLFDFLNFLNISLNSSENVSLCRNSINCLSCLIRSLDYDIEQYLDELIQKIFLIVNDPLTDNSIRCNCFIVISDMFLYIPKIADKYLNEIMTIIYNAIQATLVFNYNGDNDLLEYYKCLRRNILETFYYMIHSNYRKEDQQQNINGSTSESSKSALIDGMIKRIFEFIDITLDNFKNNIDYDFVTIAIEMIIDLSIYDKEAVKKYLDNVLLSNIMKILNTSSHQKHLNLSYIAENHLCEYLYS